MLNSSRRGWDLHYWISALLLTALVPLLRRLHLPVAFDWGRLLSVYWLVLAAQTFFVAGLLFAIGAPYGEGLGPFLKRMSRDKRRILLAAIFFLILLWALGWAKAVILTGDAVVLLEFLARVHGRDRRAAIVGVFAPASYLFVGFLLVFAYNDIILSARFFAQNDAAFYAADKWLLGGNSVAAICHWAVGRFPLWFFNLLHLVYIGMFPQVGAALVISSLRSGKARGLQFVGAIVTAYYIALALFYLWPSQGPYYLCPIHFSDFPKAVPEYTMQLRSIANSQTLWAHAWIARISTDYYIAFPCMHLAQPLIVLWFLRHWKRAVMVLAAYDLLLVVAILLLEWHYLIDILASVPVAGLAIASVDGREFWNWLRRREATVAG